MPDFPRANSQAQVNINLDTRPREVARTGSADKYLALSNAADKTVDIATKWSNAMDTVQATTAKANVKSSVLDIENRAASDPDYNNLDKYVKEIKDLKQANVKGFQNKTNEQLTGMEIDLDLQIAQLNVENAYKKKALDVGRASSLKLIDLAQSDYINAANEEEKMVAVSNMKNEMLKQQQSSIFGWEEGNKIVDKKIDEAQDALKDRESLRRVKEKEFRLANEAAVNDNEKNYIKMKVSGVDKLGTPISREELVSMVRKDLDNNVVSPEFADKYITALKSPKALGAKTIDKDFSDMMTAINEGKKSPEKILQTMLDLVQDGHLSENDFAAVSSYFNMISGKQPDDLVAMNVRKSWVGIEVFSENTTAKEASRGRMSRSFINKLQTGVNAQDASIEAMREEVLYLHPEVINKVDGLVYMDDSGRTKKILPNGDITEIQSTVKDTRTKEKK